MMLLVLLERAVCLKRRLKHVYASWFLGWLDARRPAPARQVGVGRDSTVFWNK